VPLQNTARPSFSRPRPILKDHDTASFFSRYDCLNNWLKGTALKAEARTARTYVVCPSNSKLVLGYYCLAMGSVIRTEAPPKLRRNTPSAIPVMLLGRLAVDTHFEGQGIGGGMLKDAFQRVVQLSDQAGCRCILVHAIDRNAVSYYARFGFSEFPNGSRTMFLPVENIRAAVEGT